MTTPQHSFIVKFYSQNIPRITRYKFEGDKETALKLFQKCIDMTKGWRNLDNYQDNHPIRQEYNYVLEVFCEESPGSNIKRYREQDLYILANYFETMRIEYKAQAEKKRLN